MTLAQTIARNLHAELTANSDLRPSLSGSSVVIEDVGNVVGEVLSQVATFLFSQLGHGVLRFETMMDVTRGDLRITIVEGK